MSYRDTGREDTNLVALCTVDELALDLVDICCSLEFEFLSLPVDIDPPV